MRKGTPGPVKDVEVLLRLQEWLPVYSEKSTYNLNRKQLHVLREGMNAKHI